MGRRSAILALVGLATAGVAGLAWRIGADGERGPAGFDLAPPRVHAAEIRRVDPGTIPESRLDRGPTAGAQAPDRSSGSEASPLVLDPTASEPLDAQASGRVAVAPPPAFDRAEPHASLGAVDGSEVPTGLLRVRAVAVAEADGEPVPLAGVRVAAYVPGEARVTQPVEGHLGDLERSPRSNRDGLVELVLPAGVDVRVVSRGDERGALSGSVEVTALSEGETRELDLRLENMAGRLLALRIVDGLTGAPIANAELRRERPAANAEPAESLGAPGALAARTDEEGSVVLDRFDLRETRLRVVAPGYGPASFAPDALEDDTTLELTRTARLDVLVALTRPEDAEAVVRLSTSRATLSLTEEPRVDGPEVEWRMHVDLAGRASFAHLPAGVPLALEVELHDELRHRAAKPIVLVPGGAGEHSVTLGPGVVLHGALRGPDGRPFGGTEIWLVAATERGPAFLSDPDAARRVAARALTSVTGEFELAAVPAGEWWVGPAPPLEAGDPRAPAPFARWIRVPAASGSFGLELHASAGLFLEGQVRGDGEAAAGVQVEARLVGTGAGTSGRCGADGRFRIGPVPPGTYEVAARPDPRARHSGSSAVLAEPGDELQLELLPGRVLVIQGFDDAGVTPALGRVRWTRSDVGPFAAGEHRVESGASSVVVSGLDAGTYDVFATTADGRVGRTPGVRMEGTRARREVRVQLSAPAQLSLENGGTEVVSFEVFAGRCSVAVGELAPGETEQVLAPPGEVAVRHRTGDRAPTEDRIELGRDEGRHLLLHESAE